MELVLIFLLVAIFLFLFLFFISISVYCYYAFYDRRREREIQELKWQLDAAAHAMDHAHRKWPLVVRWVQLLEWIQNLVQFQKDSILCVRLFLFKSSFYMTLCNYMYTVFLYISYISFFGRAPRILAGALLTWIWDTEEVSGYCR